MSRPSSSPGGHSWFDRWFCRISFARWGGTWPRTAPSNRIRRLVSLRNLLRSDTPKRSRRSVTQTELLSGKGVRFFGHEARVTDAHPEPPPCAEPFSLDRLLGVRRRHHHL